MEQVKPPHGTAMMMHNLPEGMAIAFSAYTTLAESWYLTRGAPSGHHRRCPRSTRNRQPLSTLIATASGLSEPLERSSLSCLWKPFLTSTSLPLWHLHRCAALSRNCNRCSAEPLLCTACLAFTGTSLSCYYNVPQFFSALPCLPSEVRGSLSPGGQSQCARLVLKALIAQHDQSTTNDASELAL
jgi:hypothetical protein